MAKRTGRLLALALPLALSATPARAADTCAAATAETGSLPLELESTTVGATDDYYHDEFADPPQCTATGSCTGGGGGKGTVYDGTGWGPDVAYKILTSANCTVTISLWPTRPADPPDDPGDDLALFVFKSSCSDGLTDCLCVSDEGLGATGESVTLQAVGGTTYYVVVDGYTPGEPEPEEPFSEGPFQLDVAVTSGSCTLCPEGGCAVTPPSAPTGLAASDGTFADRVALSWTAATGSPSYYEVFRDTDSDPIGANGLGDTTGTDFNDFTATAGVTYTYWVKACNAGGCSDYSASNTGFRASEPPPAAIFANDFEDCGAAWSVPPPPCA